MSKKETIEDRVWALLSGIAEQNGLIPVDAEYLKEGGEYFLRVYIDREGGVGVDDCEKVSRLLDPLLDEEDIIPDPYTLEVSSPGLNRILKRPRDFIYAKGKEVEVHTWKAVGRCREFTGTLEDFNDSTVTIKNGTELRTFDRTDISLIRLAFEF